MNFIYKADHSTIELVDISHKVYDIKPWVAINQFMQLANIFLKKVT